MIEHLRPGVHARDTRVVLFDFDGTISLIRAEPAARYPALGRR